MKTYQSLETHTGAYAICVQVLKKTSKAPSGDLSDFKKIVSVNRT